MGEDAFSEDIVRRVAEEFQDNGMGMVMVCARSEGEEFKVRCFSTVDSEDVMTVLDGVSANVSLMAFDHAAIMNGEIVVHPPVENLCESVRWGASLMNMEEPMIVAAVGDKSFAAFAVGDAPMITYLAIRVITSIRHGGRGLDVRDMNVGLN
jgi:hypothetical protein